ncbi:Myb-like_DNA-binding domain-containing protein [Hexamita inflata]|uniref:Myb-like DNA-binding domain-containing protein n=1 Tax=Hexamita inflata TaxID=28002 RepID=A0AA86V4I4_9EUKA|nr:Myb-like DNA-binding domain-containing protein [Hexamita inflata]
MSYREWTKDEINKLITAAEQFKRGRGIDWKQVANYVNTRSERQCQDRYFSRTKNGVVTKTNSTYSVWTPDEENLLKELVSQHGHKWSLFVDYFPGRDANKIKAKYYNFSRQAGNSMNGGSSYDSSFVEQQRSCFSNSQMVDYGQEFDPETDFQHWDNNDE